MVLNNVFLHLKSILEELFNILALLDLQQMLGCCMSITFSNKPVAYVIMGILFCLFFFLDQ